MKISIQDCIYLLVIVLFFRLLRLLFRSYSSGYFLIALILGTLILGGLVYFLLVRARWAFIVCVIMGVLGLLAILVSAFSAARVDFVGLIENTAMIGFAFYAYSRLSTGAQQQAPSKKGL